MFLDDDRQILIEHGHVDENIITQQLVLHHHYDCVELLVVEEHNHLLHYRLVIAHCVQMVQSVVL